GSAGSGVDGRDGRRVRRGEARHDLVDLLLRDNEGWRYDDQVAADAVGVPHVGPDHETSLQRGLGERLGEPGRPWERGPAGLVFHELDARKQAPSPDVPPVEEPPTGSAMNAATVSAPARRIAASRAVPLQVGHAASAPRHSQRYA